MTAAVRSSLTGASMTEPLGRAEAPDPRPDVPPGVARGPARFEVFSTCPASTEGHHNYRARVAEVSRWSEAHGHRGLLIYADNALADPWLVAHAVIESTERIVPLVAAQPVYAHPYTVAKTISSLALMWRRRVALNLVTGGFARHLGELGDDLADQHDRRYDRLREYTQIIQRLLAGELTTTGGRYYRLRGVRLQPPMPEDLVPDYYVSGRSAAAAELASVVGARRVTYAGPPGDVNAGDQPVSDGIRIGIIARDRTEQAWREAHARFPPDPVGQRTQELAGRLTQSAWHVDLSRRAREADPPGSPYWLVPFRTYKTFCPYIVGSHDEVAQVLAGYHAAGIRTIILDTPRCEDDVEQASAAFARCYRLTASRGSASVASTSRSGVRLAPR